MKDLTPVSGIGLLASDRPREIYEGFISSIRDMFTSFK